MSLDHQTGEMRGEVLHGRLAGRALIDLDREQLTDLFQQFQTDPQSAAVLEAYLDRNFPDWRNVEHGGSGASGSDFGDMPMTPADAYQILGLEPDASQEEIKTAHRRLMQRLHPDHGGSTYLAARVNQAKDVLLGARG
jgi:hypothetical protein